MAMSGDTTLQERPELFELAEGGRTRRFFRMNAVVSAVFMVAVSIAGFTVLELPTVGVIAAIMAVGSPATMLWLSTRSREWRLRDGRALRQDVWGLDDEPEESWQRLATGDPAVYTPLRVSGVEQAPVRLYAFWPADERVTYVVIVRNSGPNGNPSQIIELRDQQHDDFQAARERRLRAA